MDFETYVHESGRALLRFAVVLTDDPELAQDVVQDVLLKAQQHWPTIAAADRPHAYVRRMLANQVISWRRKWARIEARPDRYLETAVADPTAAVDRRDELLRRLGTLPTNQRAAIVMRYFEDMPDGDIADVLGCSANTVRVHVHRGLTALRVEHRVPSTVVVDA